jgi:hypothetical protein
MLRIADYKLKERRLPSRRINQGVRFRKAKERRFANRRIDKRRLQSAAPCNSLLLCALGEVAFVENVLALGQARFLRIAPNVTQTVCEVILVTY